MNGSVENFTEACFTDIDTPCLNLSEAYEPRGVVLEFSTPIYLLVWMTGLYGVSFILGVFGNITAVVVLLRHRSLFETRTAGSLLNLAVADLLLILFAQPTAAMEFYTQEVWYLGNVMCKIVPLLENAVANASLLTILYISVERYVAICHPLRSVSGTMKSKTRYIMLTIWLTAFLVSSPLLVITQYKHSRFYDGSLVPVCRSTVGEIWKQCYVISLLCVFYLVPAVLFVFLYSAVIKRLTIDSCQLALISKQDTNASKNALQSRQQVVKLMIFLIFLFFGCVLPFRIVSIWFIYAPNKIVRGLGVEGYLWMTHFPRCLVYLNSAVNPVVYNLISKRFRRAFFQTLTCKCHPKTQNRARFSSCGEQFKLLPQNSIYTGSIKTRSSYLSRLSVKSRRPPAV